MKISQEIAMKSHDLFAGRSVNRIGEKNCLFFSIPSPATLVPLVLSDPISPPREEGRVNKKPPL